MYDLKKKKLKLYAINISSPTPLHTSSISAHSVSLPARSHFLSLHSPLFSLSSSRRIPVIVVPFPEKMALLSDQGAEIVIPLCAVIGIVFSLVQWFLVSKVKVSPERGGAAAATNGKNGYGEYLIEEEEGVNEQDVIVKCAEIQTAISEG